MTRGRGRNPGASTLDKHIKRKEHKERHQPAARARLGPLEKHKDYVVRARKRRAKVQRLLQIKRAAAQRNPDEFDIGMTKAVMDVATGRMKQRRRRHEAGEQAKELRRTMRSNTMSVQYLEFKANADTQRVREILNEDATAAITARAPQNKHTVFVDNEDDFRQFRATQFFDATPQMLRQHPALRGTRRVLQHTVTPEALLLSGHVMKSAAQRRKERREMQAKLRAVDADDAAARQALVDRVHAKRAHKLQRLTGEVVADAGGAHEHTDGDEEGDVVSQLLAQREAHEQEAARLALRRVKEVTQRTERSKSLTALAKTLRRQNEGMKRQLQQRKEARYKPNAIRRAR